MRETRSRGAWVRDVALLVAALVLAGAACRRDAGGEAPTGRAGGPIPAPTPAPPTIDPALDDRFAFAAGLAGTTPAYAALREEAPWKEFADLAGKAWADFGSAVLEPMNAWAGDDLWEVREKTSTLFYPFGGPDLATAFALFPGASKTVLMGLEPVGNMPDLDRASPEWRGEFFADLGALASGFLKRGYFITMDMMDVYTRGRVDGALPVIGFFLKRGGYSVIDVRRLAPDENGGWTETPYERWAKRPHRPYGVKIDYVRPGDTTSKSVYYFSCDLENKAFQEGCPLYGCFDGLGPTTTFVKSGSYLLHWGNFSTVRKFILDRSLFVLQDDTGIPYRMFKGLGWGLRLFGRYATPVKDFTNVEQMDLRQAYEDPEGNVEALPFHFGYRWVTQVDNLLLAKRPRRPYKVPVIVD
jgi:hypothetical protein